MKSHLKYVSEDQILEYYTHSTKGTRRLACTFLGIMLFGYITSIYLDLNPKDLGNRSTTNTRIINGQRRFQNCRRVKTLARKAA